MFVTWNDLCALTRRIRKVEAQQEADSAVTYVASADTPSYDVLDTDTLIVVDSTGGPASVNLPSASEIEGKRFTIKRIPAGGSNVTITAQVGENIDAANTLVLSTAWKSVTLQATSTGYVIVSDY